MDAIDREAKARGISRATMMAYYQRQAEMRGQNGTDAATAAPKPAARPQAKRDPRSAYQRIMDALSGNP